MRIAGMIPKGMNTEVQYVCSVHTVSRWIHELCERPEFTNNPPAGMQSGEAPPVAA